MKITPLQDWIERKINCPSGMINRKVIDDYQIEEINKNLRYVRQNSRFYKNLFEKCPEKINSLEEFAEFPFTTSDDLRADSSQFLCVSQNEISRIVTLNTSGTTGQPKRCFFTPDDQELTIDFFGAGMSTLVDTGDRVLILLPDATPGSVGDLLFRGLERIGAIPFKHGPVCDLSETLQAICDRKIDSLVGVPTQVLALVRFQQIHPTQYPVKLKSILLSTDYVPDAIISAISSAWQCQVYNHYGMTEMGLGGGVFCEGQYGYHLREADMYFEIIDPVTGRKLPDGEFGEVVFTTLTRQGLPLIRYRTGDISRFLVAPCSCGTCMKSLQKVNGRLDQQFSIDGCNLKISDLDESLFQIKNLINYQLTISHKTDKDILQFKLFCLQGDETSIVEPVKSELSRLGIDPSRLSISYELIDGYPEELSSMRKRKVLEEFPQTNF
jgi:phenylacetate-CoA ligase